MCFLAVVIGYTDRVNMSVAVITMQEIFGWSQSEKGVVLSAFFIGYILALIPAGWIATRFGGKRTLAVAVTGWSLFTLATPFAAQLSFEALLAARIGLGLCEGALFPACYELLGRWVPAHERSRGAIRLTSGIPIGQVGGLMASGWIVARYGWEWAFHIFGVAGLLWVLIWLARVKSDPRSDPEVLPGELALLDEQSAASSTAYAPVPWCRLIRAPAVWAAIIALFCGNWGLYFLLSWLPSYFRETQGVSIAAAGMFAAAPWIGYFVFGNVVASIGDAALKRGANVTRVRKSVLFLSFLAAAIFFYWAKDARSATAALILLFCSAGALAGASAAYSANFFELLPGRGALFIAVGNTIATIPGIVGVATTGWIVDETGSYTAAFLLAALITLGGGLFYLRFGSGDAVMGQGASH